MFPTAKVAITMKAATSPSQPSANAQHTTDEALAGSGDVKHDSDQQAAAQLAAVSKQITTQIGKQIVGQSDVISQLLTAVFARGHCLLVGVPGLAKTLLIRTLAQALQLTFRRIQFTPDLMPSDITGSDILEENRTTGRREFRFVKGPVFANLVLADEINRTPPKTQAALLQAMEEYRVTAGGRTFSLTPPFLVFATQNPIEQEGTYPLPEAQLDRFMFQVDVGYPSQLEEEQIVLQHTSATSSPIETVLSADKIVTLQKLIPRVPVASHVIKFAVALVRASRPDADSAPKLVNNYVSWGAGPRASQHLVLAAKTRAIMHGRFAVSEDDVRSLARPILQHRLILNYKAEADGIRPSDIVAQLLELVRA